MPKKSLLHRITRVLVEVLFYAGIVACAALPFIMPELVSFLYYDETMINWYIFIVFPAGVCTVFILFQLKTMLKSLVSGDPFTDKNVDCLRRCGFASFLISIFFLIRILHTLTVASTLIVVIFALLGLFSLTMKDVFKQAVFYKKENDWTV